MPITKKKVVQKKVEEPVVVPEKKLTDKELEELAIYRNTYCAKCDKVLPECFVAKGELKYCTLACSV